MRGIVYFRLHAIGPNTVLPSLKIHLRKFANLGAKGMSEVVSLEEEIVSLIVYIFLFFFCC